MEEIEALFASLAEAPVCDIQVPGFIDRDGTYPRFVPMADTAYLVRESDFVRMEVLHSDDQLNVQLVEAPGAPKALEGEDEEFAMSSYGELFLGDDYSSFRITKIRYALSNGSDPSAGRIRCAELEFENSLRLFADPGYFFGIRLQGAGAYERWLNFSRTAESPFGPIQEFIWSPRSTE
ncbi:hypothetical protein [Streptomyces sp. NBC_01481]|uniref:hypothetical protein n=1 Tax=Streptomyces sp. NBC_01481 TaxID=2975869 RepID=UPI00225AA5C0|nr:hypothetical protein [Streptomyces sp. NBC_01481]MCX4587128.1 hypothetical protein [Streptomyces sp. NBC_01481]